MIKKDFYKIYLNKKICLLNKQMNNQITTIEWNNGTKMWYKQGKRHRDNDLPAIEWMDQSKMWCKEGKLHRDNDLPAIIWKEGLKEWYINGIRHRENDLPAVEDNNVKKWYKYGLLHRDNDLPAIEYINGEKFWYKNGEKYIPEENYKNFSVKCSFCRKITTNDLTTYNEHNECGICYENKNLIILKCHNNHKFCKDCILHSK
jgi:hypothetical protein